MDNKTLTEHIFNISNQITKIGVTVDKHDKETFPKIESELLKQSDALYRMESKQNDDIEHFTKEKEDILARIKPLEDDLQKRQKKNTEIKGKIWDIIWAGLERIIYIIIGAGVIYWKTLKEKIFTQ